VASVRRSPSGIDDSGTGIGIATRKCKGAVTVFDSSRRKKRCERGRAGRAAVEEPPPMRVTAGAAP